MKQSIFLLACLLSFAACRREPPPLDLTRFDVAWLDLDHSGTRTLDDELDVDILINVTDRDPDDQFIEQWEFSCFVNGAFVGVLLGDTNADANSVTANLEIVPRFLETPQPLKPGDLIEFRLFAVDNFGTELSAGYSFRLEP